MGGEGRGYFWEEERVGWVGRNGLVGLGGTGWLGWEERVGWWEEGVVCWLDHNYVVGLLPVREVVGSDGSKWNCLSFTRKVNGVQ